MLLKAHYFELVTVVELSQQLLSLSIYPGLFPALYSSLCQISIILCYLWCCTSLPLGSPQLFFGFPWPQRLSVFSLALSGLASFRSYNQLGLCSSCLFWVLPISNWFSPDFHKSLNHMYPLNKIVQGSKILDYYEPSHIANPIELISRFQCCKSMQLSFNTTITREIKAHNSCFLLFFTTHNHLRNPPNIKP